VGLSVSGVEELKFILQKASSEAPKHIFEQMKREGKKMQQLARMMAPVDMGNLEDAITLSTEGGGRDMRGRFMSKVVAVFIDMNQPVPERPGHVVGEYAYEMHEHLTPMGPKKLGKKSVAKQSGQSEQVGGGFMERAAEQIEAGLMSRLIDIARTYL
jgi:hypothetical protein